jgi:hypothetical protein
VEAPDRVLQAPVGRAVVAPVPLAEQVLRVLLIRVVVVALVLHSPTVVGLVAPALS